MHTPAERISEHTRMPPWLRHEHAARYAWAAGLAAGNTIVDAACGTGYGTKQLVAAGATRADGFDLSLEAIEEARRLHAAPGIRFEVADVTALPCPDHSY